MQRASLFLIFLCATLSTVTLPALAEPTDKPIQQGLLDAYQAEKITEHTYVIHGPMELPSPENKGFMNNPGFIVADEAIAVIDPGSSIQIGRALLNEIQKVSDKPITHVFNTHVHGDHWLGNQAFFEANPDVEIYAHPEMIKEAQDGAADQWVETMLSMTEKATEGTKAIIPSKALEDGQVVKFGNLSIKAHLNEHAHTKTDAMFEVVEDKTLFTGDNVTHKRIPRMVDGSFRGSISTINKALESDFEKVVPGHGPTGGKEVLEVYNKYLSTIYEEVKVLAEEGLESFEMKEKITEKLADYKDWSGFENEVGKHISLAVLEAEQADFE